MSISGSCLPERSNLLEHFLLLYRIAHMDRYIGVLAITVKPWSYPSGVDEGTTIAIISDMNFVFL